MRCTLIFFAAIFLLPMVSFSQVFIAPFAGYQADVNNPQFKLVNTGLQLVLKKSKWYELIFQVQKSWSKTISIQDSSFTLNANLPLYAPAAKSMRPSSFTAGIGNRFKIAGKRSLHGLYAKISGGLVYQQVFVTYKYDKINYTVLNPDQSMSATGLYISGGLEYIRQLKTGRLFAEVNISSPPATSKLNYPYSFHTMAALSFNLGYSLQIKHK